MTTSVLDWHRLRPLDNSQQKAFEELCSQLAGAEKMPPGSKFVRKGSPDAGIECYWELPNGQIHGWQAKFFRDVPKQPQWSQIDESVSKAVTKHERLAKYTICLPIDRADPKNPGEKSFMDRWVDHVHKWQEMARSHALSVAFEYWGQSEIAMRLAQEQHRGRHYFWFNKELFSHEWFKNKLDEAIANVGPRYFPEVNVELPLAECFRGLGRTLEFYEQLDRLRGEIRRGFEKLIHRKLEEDQPARVSALRLSVGTLVQELTRIDPVSPSSIPLASLRAEARRTAEAASALASGVRETARKSAPPQERETGPAYSRSSDSDLHYLYEIRQAVVRLYDITESSEAILANLPALLLSGDAGVGKTHLLCDIARARERSDQPTVLLLGEQFSREQPWSQVIKLLGLGCGAEEFLGALNASGQSRGLRALIFVDALNEGEGLHLWKMHLAGMLTQISRYPWIGVALSVRRSYEAEIVPANLVPAQLLKVYHRGFEGFEADAVTRFFAHYNIATPGIPLIRPEFRTPYS